MDTGKPLPVTESQSTKVGAEVRMPVYATRPQAIVTISTGEELVEEERVRV